VTFKPKIVSGIVCVLVVTYFFAHNVYARSAEEFYRQAKDYIKEGKYDDAIIALNKAIRIGPALAEYYTARGELYRNKNDVKRALRDYSKSIELSPGNAEVYYYRAICYYFTKEYDKAWSDVHTAESMGYEVPQILIQDLQEATGRDR
jgi:DnaJ family protein C protein 3